jgi:hypothetical protein
MFIVASAVLTKKRQAMVNSIFQGRDLAFGKQPFRALLPYVFNPFRFMLINFCGVKSNDADLNIKLERA